MRPHRYKGRTASAVGIRELKANLSSYVRRAAAGEKVLITDRGRAVADLVPHVPEPLSQEELEHRLHEMAKKGLLERATSKDVSFLLKRKGLGLSSAQLARLRRDFEWSRGDKS